LAEIGAAIATDLTYFANLIGMFYLASKYVDYEGAFFVDLRLGAKDLIPYMRIAIPSCLLFCMKNWAMQILNLMSA
jgi:Na+-driven multidrug efflux pump